VSIGEKAEREREPLKVGGQYCLYRSIVQNRQHAETVRSTEGNLGLGGEECRGQKGRPVEWSMEGVIVTWISSQM